jgi:hypothetical protein
MKRNPYEKSDVVRKIISKLVMENWNGIVWTGFSWLRIRDRLRAVVTTVMDFRFPKKY